MTLGQRILQSRLEAGLSQRQLAGEEITRNMLSAIEHDTANPSVSTLRYLANRLGKPISYLLGEDVPPAEGYDRLLAAREAYDGGEYRRCAELLDDGAPGEVIAREWALLSGLSRMKLAARAIEEGRLPYARELLAPLEREAAMCPYFESERELRLLMARSGLETTLVSDDDSLLLRARRALEEGRPADAVRYLEAAEGQDTPTWHHLRGEAEFARKNWRQAADHFHRAEAQFDLRSRLEVCYRELEDYKMAYFYAKQGKS